MGYQYACIGNRFESQHRIQLADLNDLGVSLKVLKTAGITSYYYIASKKSNMALTFQDDCIFHLKLGFGSNSEFSWPNWMICASYCSLLTSWHCRRREFSWPIYWFCCPDLTDIGITSYGSVTLHLVISFMFCSFPMSHLGWWIAFSPFARVVLCGA